MNNHVYAITPARTLPALEWSATLLVATDYDTAEEACASLGDGWRMPTITELLSLVDYAKPLCSVDTAAFPDTVQDWYWSSTLCALLLDDGDSRWAVDFGYANSMAIDRERTAACVRAVREVKHGAIPPC